MQRIFCVEWNTCMNQEFGTQNAFPIADPFSFVPLFSSLKVHFALLVIDVVPQCDKWIHTVTHCLILSVATATKSINNNNINNNNSNNNKTNNNFYFISSPQQGHFSRRHR
jgi:hypothetical protein